MWPVRSCVSILACFPGMLSTSLRYFFDRTVESVDFTLLYRREEGHSIDFNAEVPTIRTGYLDSFVYGVVYVMSPCALSVVVSVIAVVASV